MANDITKRLENKTIYVNKEMVVIVEDKKKIVGVLTLVNDKVAKVAGEKGIGTLLYYAALALKKGIRPNEDNVTDAASKIWEYKFKGFPKQRLKDYKHKKQFLNYKYLPPNQNFVNYFNKRFQTMNKNLENLAWKYVEKSMTKIYGKAI